MHLVARHELADVVAQPAFRIRGRMPKTLAFFGRAAVARVFDGDGGDGDRLGHASDDGWKLNPIGKGNNVLAPFSPGAPGEKRAGI